MKKGPRYVSEFEFPLTKVFVKPHYKSAPVRMAAGGKVSSCGCEGMKAAAAPNKPTGGRKLQGR